ncbi:MAG: hypothetical protein JST10_04875 [Bacteroidetes bacterium]|nr:hypothetical protein [Bacteroidota bacterium]MBS1631887.1 hypothetical protein [Bacteroidota bacterium]
MEVHHHSHTEDSSAKHGSKRFKHYLFEFFMLFLAVFCGFLAENFREHQVEHQREKQYIITLLEDLKTDVPLLDSTIYYWSEVNNSVDSVTDAIVSTLNKTDFPKAYRHINEALNYWSFTYNDRTISQLKSAGAFRLIRNKKVAEKIVSYDQFNNNEIKNILLIHTKFYENALALRSKVFAENIISEIFRRYKNTPAPYSENSRVESMIKENNIPLTKETQSTLMFEFKNSLLAMKRDYDNLYWSYTVMRKMNLELTTLIQKEYDLK